MTFVADGIMAMTDIDIMKGERGTYSGPISAKKRLRRRGAAVVVNENITACCQKMAADGQTDALGPGRDERALAGKFCDGGHGRRFAHCPRRRKATLRASGG